GVSIGVAELPERQLLDAEPARQISIELMQKLDRSGIRLRRYASRESGNPAIRASIQLQGVEPDRSDNGPGERAQSVLELPSVAGRQPHRFDRVPDQSALIRSLADTGEAERFAVDLLTHLLQFGVRIASAIRLDRRERADSNGQRDRRKGERRQHA